MMIAKLLYLPTASHGLRSTRSILLYRLLALLSIVGASFVAAPASRVSAVMQPVTQLVAIVVRDGAGNPMMGVSILIKIDNPPVLEDDDKCLTDEDGTCIVHLFPNTYRVQFIYGWHDWAFIPVEDQEIFTLSVIPRDQTSYNFFVIAERDGQLVPVWDMSRDSSQPPKPFLPSFGDKDPLADLYLGPLNTDVEGAPPPGDAPSVEGATPTIQVVIDELAPGVAAAPATTIPVSPTTAAAPAADGGLTLRGVLGLLFALALVAMVILLVVVIANRPKRKER